MRFLPLIFLLILSSCRFALPDPMDQGIDYRPSSFNEAWQWVSQNIQYEADPPGGHKKLPWETYSDRTGDCEDFAILLMYFAETLGEDTLFIGLQNNTSGGKHAVILHRGVYKEPAVYGGAYASNLLVHNKIIVSMTYEQVYYTRLVRSAQ